MTLDHPALWGIDASLEELRGKIGHLVKCAIQKSKVAWSNFIAKRCHIRSVCYHAYRDFLYALFERSPHARVVTSLTVYEGFRNFESTYWRSGKLNVGSFFEPMRFEDCCDCLKKFPQIEEMVPEMCLSEYALDPDRDIYSGLNLGEKRR